MYTYRDCSVAERDEVNGCTLKSNIGVENSGPVLGYLAGRQHTTTGRRRHHRDQACGSVRSPWLVAARRGQRIRFTLMDFSSSADDLDVVDVVNDDDVVDGDAAQSPTMSLQHSDGQLNVFFDSLFS